MQIDTSGAAFDPRYVLRRNHDLGLNLDGLVIGTDARPYRANGSALLVPVDVQALAVPVAGGVDHADTAVHLLDADSFDDAPEVSAAPFTDGAPREAGIYLHWAMPDALTRGTTDADGTLHQAVLPDRWLILRLERGSTRRWTGWVVESEYARVSPLRGWTGEPGEPDGEPPRGWIPRSRLSAAAGGDPAWAATYDNVRDRFAFRDPLNGTDESVVSYVVVGWYSDEALDPLDAVRSQGSFDQVMASLGWTISAEAGERARREAALRARSVATASTTADERPSVGHVDRPEVRGMVNERAWAVDALADLVLTSVDTVWPQRCVFHGAVFGVRRDGRGVDHRPVAAALAAAAGATATEALARLIGDRQAGAGPGDERALAAFALGVADRLGEPDGPALVEERLHGRAFETRPGEPLTDWIERRDRLGPVRPKRPSPAEGHVRAGSGAIARDLIADGSPAVLAGEAPSVAGNVVADLDSMLISDDAATRARSGATDGGIRANWQASFEFVSSGSEHLQNVVRPFSPDQALKAAARQVERVVQVTRAGPRYHQPQDPVVAVQGTERNLRHGYDGRWTADETVACRLAGDTQHTWDDVDGADLLAWPLVHAALPPEAAHLVEEAVLEDPSNLAGTIAAAQQAHPETASDVKARIEAEIVIGRYGRDPEKQTDALAAVSSREGTLSSAIGFNEWIGQPWIPLHLEWEAELDVGDRLAPWRLGELDLEPPSELPTEPTAILSGRSLLTSASVKALASEIRRTLDEEDLRDLTDAGELSEQTETTLRRVARAAERMDVLTAGMDGIRDHLLGMPPNVVLRARPADAPPVLSTDGAPPAEPLPTGPALLARAGVARLRRARLVDAFGRALEVSVARLLVSESLQVPPGVRLASDPPDEPDDRPDDGPDDAVPGAVTPPRMLLRPRVNLPTRLLLRLLDKEDDGVEVNVDQRPGRQRTPVAGWLVPDHIDHALEVFSPEGLPIGQLRRDMVVTPGVHGAVVWEGAPGKPGPTGVSPGELIDNRHVRSMVQQIVERDLARRELPDGDAREGPLSALLRALDTTQWTVDPVSSLGWEFPGSLVGRPLAVVRAQVSLEILGDLGDPRWHGIPESAAQRRAAFDRLRSREFPVRLGSLTRRQDGLFGFFVDDDYWQLRPVHPSVLSAALPSGPGRGYQQDADRAATFDPTTEVESVADPYLVRDPTIMLRPGQTRMLTLLLDPGLSLHVTAGMVPRKSISLQRDWVGPALRVLAPSFRIGPVLVDPTTIRMPKPAGMPGRLVWTHRDSPTSWRDDPIEAASQAARLPDGAHVTQEGWIRLVYDEGDPDG